MLFMKLFEMISNYTNDQDYNYIVACLNQTELKHLEGSLMKYEEGLKVPPYIERFGKKEDNELILVQSYYELRWNCY